MTSLFAQTCIRSKICDGPGYISGKLDHDSDRSQPHAQRIFEGMKVEGGWKLLNSSEALKASIVFVSRVTLTLWELVFRMSPKSRHDARVAALLSP